MMKIKLETIYFEGFYEDYPDYGKVIEYFFNFWFIKPVFLNFISKIYFKSPSALKLRVWLGSIIRML